MARMTSPQGKAEEDGRFCTYRVFDPDIQKFIYVGMTSNLQRRIKEHGKNSKWWKPTLRFDSIKEGMSRKEAGDDEKYWIQHYADRGHPLENSNNHYHVQTERFMILTWLGADTENPSEEIEEVIQYFFRGREFLAKRNQEDAEWHYSPEWDCIYFSVCSVISELEKTHGFQLTHLDIARLTAKALGMNIDNEVAE